MSANPNGASIVSSNAGYSGTPLWKLKQQGAVQNINKIVEEAEEQKLHALDEENSETLRVSVDAVSLGRAEGIGEKPLVRHIIVKDLRKVAARSKMALPQGGLFENRAPLMFFAVFDGQSCADTPGPLTAEWCAKQVIPKLLRNLSALPAGYENQTFVKATLTKTFDDLDKEILRNQPGIHDGCGAAVALLVGEKLFSSVIGKCEIVLCEAGGPPQRVRYNPIALGSNQGRPDLPEETQFLQEAGGVVYTSEAGVPLVSGPSGASTSVSRSLGDRAWKGPDGGVPGSIKLLKGTPETRVTDLSWAERHQFMVLSSAPVAQTVTPDDCISAGAEFHGKPRAIAGEVTSKASEFPQNASAQCTSVVVHFIPKDEKAGGPPAAKKARKEAESVRLRHIVVKHRDCGQPFDPVRGRPIVRSREEAEAMLRTALRELNQEAKNTKTSMDASKAKLAALQPSPKYVSLCKELSECTTAQKGGGMMGDLGWLSNEGLHRFGPSFAETAKSLGVGQWSDLASSEHGIHILQRIA
mmetsp:Transcript_21121/g.45794  ORF Transcript_21121/g.45794 Transcript_21121/m.45794 type:complete len:526 (+) Transcript_21121:88-1665(+)